MSIIEALQDIQKVSVHGGHSGQFCHHAKDSLEDIVLAYIEQGFTWVGLTEHMPPPNDLMRYPDEVEAEISAELIQQKFNHYFLIARDLKLKYANQIEIFTAFETETYKGSTDYVVELIKTYKPDYLVGSVHHVGGISIDVNKEDYHQAVNAAGSLEALYCQYFDAQFEMLQALEPAVVGHFDLIRIFDNKYLERLVLDEVWQRVLRNLEFIAEHDLIVDFNLRGFDKNSEQYPSMPILTKAVALGIKVVPGDDSHGVSSVGKNYLKGLEILRLLNVNTQWPKPRLIDYA